MSGILQDKHILVTRAEHQAEEFADQIKQHGGKPYIVPLLKISRIVDRNYLEILENIEQYEWIFFTSANGVHCFFQIWKNKFGMRELSHHKFAVVGRKTNEVLQEYGYEASFIRSEERRVGKECRGRWEQEIPEKRLKEMYVMKCG